MLYRPVHFDFARCRERGAAPVAVLMLSGLFVLLLGILVGSMQQQRITTTTKAMPSGACPYSSTTEMYIIDAQGNSALATAETNNQSFYTVFDHIRDGTGQMIVSNAPAYLSDGTLLVERTDLTQQDDGSGNIINYITPPAYARIKAVFPAQYSLVRWECRGNDCRNGVQGANGVYTGTTNDVQLNFICNGQNTYAFYFQHTSLLPTATPTPTITSTPPAIPTPTGGAGGGVPGAPPGGFIPAPVTQCGGISIVVKGNSSIGAVPLAAPVLLSYESASSTISFPQVVTQSALGAQFTWSQSAANRKPIVGSHMIIDAAAAGYIGKTIVYEVPDTCATWTQEIVLEPLTILLANPLPIPPLQTMRVVAKLSTDQANKKAVLAVTAANSTPNAQPFVVMHMEQDYSVANNCSSFSPRSCREPTYFAHDFILGQAMPMNISLRADGTVGPVVNLNSAFGQAIFTVDITRDKTFVNSFADSEVVVDALKSSADFDRSGQVNAGDFVLFLQALSRFKNQNNYDPLFDLCGAVQVQKNPIGQKDAKIDDYDLRCMRIALQLSE